MIAPSAGTRIWIAAGVTDLRRGLTGLSGLVQTALEQNPFSGKVFVFRGRRGDLIKLPKVPSGPADAQSGTAHESGILPNR